MTVKRGDLAIVVSEHSAGEVGLGSGTYLRCELHTVASTRGGQVATVRHARDQNNPDAWCRPLEKIHGFVRALVIPAADVDVQAALEVARKRCWPGGGSWMWWESPGEMREALLPTVLDAAGRALLATLNHEPEGH